ncbi:hypothetical protein [Ferruginibacter sp.]|uniref:hypothetical protein n=1 Tax=Ferruginibacter sp. TaxID=1940288 RepID=UPI00265A3DF5|nr:hypothetical protein [Ferruginibacter sp.]
MIQFITTILKFGEKGEKNGWTYIVIPAVLAQQLSPGNKKIIQGKREAGSAFHQRHSINTNGRR